MNDIQAGTGPVVRGPAEAVVMAMSGRTAAWASLTGDGAGLLRHRISQETVLPLPNRLNKIAATFLRPSNRRFRDVGPPTPPLSSSASGSRPQ